jgi:hypothetical protein
MMRDRNPYVLLGIEFGSSREFANVAFAKRARPLKKLAKSSDRAHDLLFDLTWALNQIDEAITNPAVTFDFYRVPADASAFSPSGNGLFSPPMALLERQTNSTASDLSKLTECVLQELLTALCVQYSLNQSLPSP